MPVQIAPTIQLTYAMVPDLKLISGSVNNATSGNILNATDQEVYIVAAALDVIKDVTSTSIVSTIRVTVGGLNVYLLSLNTTTLTAETRGTNITIPYPGLKIDRNTSIAVTNGTSTANITAKGAIIYYTMSK
jgi:hypothetical protein